MMSQEKSTTYRLKLTTLLILIDRLLQIGIIRLQRLMKKNIKLGFIIKY